MSKTKMIVLGSILILSVIAGVVFFQNRSSVDLSNATEVDWRVLGELDYITGKAGKDLEALNGKDVRVPGFMVPLEDNSQKVTEFLLVPSPQACIHVPPPPPNQMVFVEMDSRSDAKVVFGPVWVYGKLMLNSKKHMYGESSFTMKGVQIERYR